jgi:hypothetical protein
MAAIALTDMETPPTRTPAAVRTMSVIESRDAKGKRMEPAIAFGPAGMDVLMTLRLLVAISVPLIQGF